MPQWQAKKRSRCQTMRKFFLIIIPVFLIFALSVTIFSMATQTTAPKEARETSSVPTAYATGDQSPEAQRTYTNQVTPYPTEQTTNNGTPPAAPLAPQATPAPTAVKPKAVTIAQERCEFWAIRKAAGNGYLLQRIASTNPLNLGWMTANWGYGPPSWAGNQTAWNTGPGPQPPLT